MELQSTWTNETSVADVLKQLQHECRAYPYKKRLICDKLAAVFVQIPPALFQGMDDLAWPIPEAMCATILQCDVYCCEENGPPEQIHLSLVSNDFSSMGVTWVTLDSSRSVVQYGLSSHNLSFSTDGSLDTYKSAGWHGIIHRVLLVELLANTTYYYRVGDPSIDSWSPIYSFTTFYPKQTITFAVIADMDFGVASDGTVKDLTALVENGIVQAVIHSGDISYADGYEPHWDVFFNKIQPIASKVPYMVSPGNHEFWYNFSSYKHRFTMPDWVDKSVGSGDNMFYSWEAGYAHFISIDSESAVDTAYVNDIELRFIQKDLATVDRKKTPWLIAHMHRPAYCSDDHACLNNGKPYGNAEYLRKRLEDTLVQYGVNLVLQGHVHSYERSYPVYNQTVTSKSYEHATTPTYILQGSSGNREGNKGSYPPDSQCPEWSAARHTDVGFGLMTVHDDKIDWSFYKSSYTTTYSDSAPVILDQFQLVR